MHTPIHTYIQAGYIRVVHQGKGRQTPECGGTRRGGRDACQQDRLEGRNLVTKHVVWHVYVYVCVFVLCVSALDDQSTRMEGLRPLDSHTRLRTWRWWAVFSI
jgi:hypothetical protein